MEQIKFECKIEGDLATVTMTLPVPPAKKQIFANFKNARVYFQQTYGEEYEIVSIVEQGRNLQGGETGEYVFKIKPLKPVQFVDNKKIKK